MVHSKESTDYICLKRMYQMTQELDDVQEDDEGGVI